MDNKRLGELVGASVASGEPMAAEAVTAVLTDAELLQAVEQRGLAVGTTALEGAAATETTEVTTPKADILEELSAEQRERATALQAAMAEKFSTEENPLSPEDFGVVSVGEGENRKLVVMLTTDNGLYKGSWNNIMSKKSAKDFTLEVDGQEVDTRSAMTWETYQAFINEAKRRGIDLLPDSEPLSKQNGQPWTGTWLTGEKADEFDALYGDVNCGEPYRGWSYRGDDWRTLRVRPAAEV